MGDSHRHGLLFGVHRRVVRGSQLRVCKGGHPYKCFFLALDTERLTTRMKTRFR